MRSKIIFLGLNLMVILFLAGCETRPLGLMASDQKDLRLAQQKIAKSAEAVSQSLQELAAIERTVHPAVQVQNPLNPEIIGMAQVTSIDWIGPIGQLVDKIAKTSHYKVRTLGKVPSIPIIVSITAKNTPLADILRNANFQCGERANIAVYSANKVIELRYNK